MEERQIQTTGPAHNQTGLTLDQSQSFLLKQYIRESRLTLFNVLRVVDVYRKYLLHPTSLNFNTKGERMFYRNAANM